jgi:hypothetical protein
VFECEFLICKLTLSIIILCIGLSVQNWPKRGKFVADVKRKMEDDTSASNKSERKLEVNKVLWKLSIFWIHNCLLMARLDCGT